MTDEKCGWLKKRIEGAGGGGGGGGLEEKTMKKKDGKMK